MCTFWNANTLVDTDDANITLPIYKQQQVEMQN
jgi:hypothetical protein